MKKLILTAALTLVAASSFAQENLENEKGNGNFEYSSSSKILLDIAQGSLIKELNKVIDYGHMSYQSGQCPTPIDLSKLRRNVDELDVDYVNSSKTVNPDGKEENRSFEIRSGKVFATKEYFTSYVGTFYNYKYETNAEKKDQLISPVRTAIIHESLHLFGYNQQESTACASEVINHLESFSEVKVKRLAHKEREKRESSAVTFVCSRYKELQFDYASQMHAMNNAHLLYLLVDTRFFLIDKKGSDKQTITARIGKYLISNDTDDDKCKKIGVYLNNVYVFPTIITDNE